MDPKEVGQNRHNSVPFDLLRLSGDFSSSDFTAEYDNTMHKKQYGQIRLREDESPGALILL